MIAGRSVETKKRLILLLFERIASTLHISPVDVEINISEAPKANRGFRGKTGDEVELTYKIEVCGALSPRLPHLGAGWYGD